MHRLVLTTALLTALGAPACSRRAPPAPEVPRLRVTRPLRTDTEVTKTFVAQVRAIQHIDLRPIDEGYLQTVYVDEGQHVAKGARLFQILPLIYQAEVQKAEAEASLAHIEYTNTKALADKNVVSANELALAKARADGAAAAAELAATKRAMTEIRAPFDGLVGRFRVRKGSLVDASDLLTTLSDNSTMWVYFNVSEAEYIEYRSRPQAERDAPVRLIMANGKMFPAPGKVEVIEADFDNRTGNVEFRAKFDNPDGLLRHGETGKVAMTFPLRRALLIPQLATFDVLDKKLVYVVDEHHVVHSRPISVAVEMPQTFAVGSGLEDTDLLLIDGLRKVRDGAHIEPDVVDSRSVIKGLEVYAE